VRERITTAVFWLSIPIFLVVMFRVVLPLADDLPIVATITIGVVLFLGFALPWMPWSIAALISPKPPAKYRHLPGPRTRPD
jgi:hypothetical protein